MSTNEPDARTEAEARTEAPTEAAARSRRSQGRIRVLIALPLVLALIIAGTLLWTRTTPSVRGGFCSRATLELTQIIHASEGPGRIDYNRTQQVASALDLAYLADVSDLRDGAPARLREPLARAEQLLPDYRKAREEAAAAGEPAPKAPQELTDALNTFVAVYYAECI